MPNLAWLLADLRIGRQPCLNRRGHEEVACENIVVKVTERRRKMKLVCGNPSVGIAPPPAGRRDALHRLLVVPCLHRISVDADVLSQEARQSLEQTAGEFNVAMFDDAFKKDKPTTKRTCSVV